MNGLWIDVYGLAQVVVFDDSNCGEIIKKHVNGSFQFISLGDKLSLWVAEDGKLQNYYSNLTGTELWKRCYGDADTIVGNIFLTGGVDEDGDMMGLDQNQIDELTMLACKCMCRNMINF